MLELISVWDLIFLIPLSFSILYLLRPNDPENSNERKGGVAISHVGASVDPAPGTELPGSEGSTQLPSFSETSEDGESQTQSFSSNASYIRNSEQPFPQAQDSELHLQGSSLYLFLNFLRAGRMAGNVAAQVFVASWSLTGLLCNRILSRFYEEPVLFVWLSATLAFLFSLLTTRMIAALAGKRFPPTTYTHRRLIGCEGQAMHRVTLEGGVAQICDDRGALHQVQCRIEPDGIVIQEGDRIRIVDYDSEEDRYLVKAGR